MKEDSNIQIQVHGRGIDPPNLIVDGTGNIADDLVLETPNFSDTHLWGYAWIGEKRYRYLFLYKEVFQAMYETGLIDFENIPDSDKVNILTEKRDYFTGEIIVVPWQVYPEDFARANANYDLEKILTYMWQDEGWKHSFTLQNVAA